MRTAPVSFKGYDASAYAKGMQEILGHTNKDYYNVAQKSIKSKCPVDKNDISAGKKFFSTWFESVKEFFTPKTAK